MNRLWNRFCAIAALTAFAAVNVTAAALSIDVDASQPGAKISPTMWGIFFEDINFGADGGLYAELVKNRSFEFPQPLMGWSKERIWYEFRDPGSAKGLEPTNSIEVRADKPFSAGQPHYLRVSMGIANEGLMISNEGFRGIGVRKGETYVLTFRARAVQGNPALGLALLSSDGGRLDWKKLKHFASEWKKYTINLRATKTDPRGRLAIITDQPGVLDLDMVSLFPAQTFKNRPNGLRRDVAQLLADLKPGFMRFPGGCIVEGHWLTNRYQWKTTIGDLAERKLIMNRWNDEFKHRPTPDYYQSFGLGFFEFFQLCEDIGCEPLPILNCGMACQFNSGELAPMDQLDPYIQDALDLIEFANGPATSTWGRKRAAMGHPAPFNMKLLGVGNEQWGPQYLERYTVFAKALKAKHPEIKLVSSSGPGPNDDKFHFAWPKLRELNADIVDEHCYDKPAWFFDSATRYDSYPRIGPEVFMGEYAAQSDKTVSVNNRNNWECALSEAAFMTGLERNADVVVMSSYAPLSGHVDAWQWRPNLLWFDNLSSFGTPNYHVQQLFSRNRGDVVLPTRIDGQEPPSGQKPGLYATASRDAATGQIILKVVNGTAQPADVSLRIKGAKTLKSSAESIVLSSPKLEDENSLQEPRKIFPVTGRIGNVSSDFKHTFRPWSLTVLRLAAGK